MQLPITGGNLVTRSPFRLDALTGQWRLNTPIEDPEIRTRESQIPGVPDPVAGDEVPRHLGG